MLGENVTKDFVEKFIALNCRNANVQIKHALYGNQKIKKCVLHPFADEDRIGLIIEDEKRYITMDELTHVSINENECCIASNIMEVSITF